MNYTTRVIENGEATVICTEDSVIEFIRGDIIVTTDGKPERTYVMSSYVRRLYEAMKEWFESDSIKEENN